MSIKVGDFVIVGHGDRPCSQMMALVLDIKNDTAKVRYIARRLLSQCASKFRKPWDVPLDYLTRVEDFGVTVLGLRKNDDSEWYVAVQQDRESIAKYRDGMPRRWDPDGRACVITDSMVGTILWANGIDNTPSSEAGEVGS